ncbi:roundabout homolog 2-like [Octopus sinensis]|uniref:Roundabout homolog 2-like n=1 Tax=Octopus sinensis TaxID=2607531 RepID=A0A7E6FS33_9MOLL|nr:roundabout homolog 2-like [Octopus sinensis]
MVNLGFTRMLCIVYVLCAIACCTGKIEFVRYPQNAVVNLGQSSFTLSCLAKSPQKNKLHYEWTLNGHDVRSQPDGRDQTGPSLVLHNVRHGDYGWYQCIVSDPVNKEEKVVSPKAYVIQPFLGSFQNHPESGIVRVGESVALSCLTGRSVPPPRVYWEKDGIIFKSGTQKYETTKIVGQPLITVTNMTLDITATDAVSGEYICVAENNMTGDIYRSDPGSIHSAVFLREFNKEPEDMTVQLGDRAKLACSPPHSVPPATVTWYKDNKKIDFNSDFLPEDSDWDMKFESVRYDDSGEYFCVAFNNYTLPQTRTSLTAILSVVGPPQILEAPSSQNVIQKMSMKLVCRVEGHPIPVVSWYHNDMKLSATSRIFLRNSNQEFWVTNVNKADEGEYRCETWNKYGNRSAVATVHVAVPPVILLPIGHVIAEENSTKVLNCQVYGDPHPLVFWAKDGVPLLTINSRLKVLDTGLKIINISHADEGNYTCTAVNDAGNQSTTGVLSIEAPAKTQVSHRAPKKDGPHFVKYPVDTVSQIGEPVTFLCDTDDEPKPHIYWTFNNTVSFPPTVNISKDGRRLHIKSMSWKEIGKYMCFAENVQAVRNKTAHLYLRESATTPKPVKKSRNKSLNKGVPSKILGIMGNTILAVDDTLELVCKTSGLPSPRIYWVHNGRRIKTRADGRIRVLSPNKLVVKFITRHDTGNYTCVAATRVYNVSSTVPVCIVGQPKAPTLTKLYATSSTSIMLEWQPAEQEPFTNVTGYIISYKPESLYKPQFKKYMDNIPSSVTAQLVTGLEPAKTYVFTITARNRVGEGSPSDMKSASTWQAAPSEPIRLQVVQTSPVSIYLSWWRPKYLHGNLKKYQLYRDSLNWTKDQIVQELVNIDSPFISHTVRGLHPYTTYIFRVRAANVENGTELWGNFSSPITVTTEIQAPSVSPGNFTIHQIRQRTLEISWEPPPRFYQNGPLTHYVVNYKAISSIDDYPDVNRQYFPADSLKANVTGLLSGTKYSFEIAAENEAGQGPASNPVYFTTSPEAPTGSPQNLIAKSSSPTKIEVFWNPPNIEKQNSKISSYVVEISKPGGTKDIYIVHDEKGLSKHPKSVFHKTIGNLHPWTTYKVRVAAITKEVLQGQGPFSFVKTIRTLETSK